MDKPPTLGDLGLLADLRAGLERVISRSNGFFIVCGPAGSGKSTMLHAILAHLNKDDRKIWTAEERLEIRQEGLRQVQVDPAAGWTYGAALRSFLRADADVIVVGEIRDQETAQVAVEASLTGHAVFTTMHADDSVDCIVRLLGMGVPPINLADSLLGVLALRLVRQLGVHELFVNTPATARLIHRRASAQELRALAVEEGMRTLMQDAAGKCLQGHPDLEEIRGPCS